jgi:hypothetical protein
VGLGAAAAAARAWALALAIALAMALGSPAGLSSGLRGAFRFTSNSAASRCTGSTNGPARPVGTAWLAARLSTRCSGARAPTPALEPPKSTTRNVRPRLPFSAPCRGGVLGGIAWVGNGSRNTRDAAASTRWPPKNQNALSKLAYQGLLGIT